MTENSGFGRFLDTLDWLDVESGVATIGCNKRGVLRAGIGPKHEVRVPERFQITKAAIPVSEVFSQIDESAHVKDYKTSEAANSVRNDGNNSTPVSVEGNDSKSWDDIDTRLLELGVRLPTEAEWSLAVAAGITSGEADTVELLIDWISERGYWGLACDGRPRLNRVSSATLSPSVPMSSGAAVHTKQRIIRLWRKSSSSSSSSGDSAAKPDASAKLAEELTTARSALLRQLDGRVATIRLVRRVSLADTEISDSGSERPPRLPQGYDPAWRLKQEAIIALVLGIIPSFIWAFFNATPGYIESGWLNLLMGGVFIGVMSGALWRPNGVTYRLSEDGKSMRECKK
jgi:hypothetical protein